MPLLPRSNNFRKFFVAILICLLQINIWNVNDLQCTHLLEISSASVSCSVTLIEDKLLFAGYSDGSNICWNITNGDELIMYSVLHFLHYLVISIYVMTKRYARSSYQYQNNLDYA